MNLFEVQERLKDFSKGQLVQEMQMPSGTAPPFLVLSELQRRTRMEQAMQADGQGQPQSTVAEDAVNAAGVPQGGLQDMARALAPQTDMTQNDAASPVEMMAEGGSLSDDAKARRGFGRTSYLSGLEDPGGSRTGGSRERRQNNEARRQEYEDYLNSRSVSDGYIIPLPEMLSPVDAAMDAVSRYQAGDYPGAALEAASVYPTSRIVGVLNQLIPELYEKFVPVPESDDGVAPVQEMQEGGQVKSGSAQLQSVIEQAMGGASSPVVPQIMSYADRIAQLPVMAPPAQTTPSMPVTPTPMPAMPAAPAMPNITGMPQADLAAIIQTSTDQAMREAALAEMQNPTPIRLPAPERPNRDGMMQRASGGLVKYAEGGSVGSLYDLVQDAPDMLSDEDWKRLYGDAWSIMKGQALLTRGGRRSATDESERSWGQRNIGDPLRGLFQPAGDYLRDTGQPVGDALRQSRIVGQPAGDAMRAAAEGFEVSDYIPDVTAGINAVTDFARPDVLAGRISAVREELATTDDPDVRRGLESQIASMESLRDASEFLGETVVPPMADAASDALAVGMRAANVPTNIVGGAVSAVSPSVGGKILGIAETAGETADRLALFGEEPFMPETAEDLAKQSAEEAAALRDEAGIAESLRTPEEKAAAVAAVREASPATSAAPRGPAAPTSRRSGPGGAAPAPASEMSENERMLNQDKWFALARVGLGLMASTAPTFGQALGEAGMLGMESLTKAREDYRERKQAAELMALRRAAAARGGRSAAGDALEFGLSAGDVRGLDVLETRLDRLNRELANLGEDPGTGFLGMGGSDPEWERQYNSLTRQIAQTQMARDNVIRGQEIVALGGSAGSRAPGAGLVDYDLTGQE